MDVAIGDTLSHYRLLERVDGGGQGTVFKAKDLRLDRDVALKVLPEQALSDQGARRRFQKEARALSLLNHPNIQVIHDFDTQDGVDFLVSEFISGLTLKEKLSSNGSFSEQELAKLGLEITEGLACAHEHGVVHRDLSAKNLILTSEGHLKIVDFGLARFVSLPSETETTETLTASIAGTLPYMSPEQLAGQADERSDIYGVGVLLYQMATGRLPFAGLQGPALVAAIHIQPPPPPTRMNPRLSARMEDVLLKCLEKDPQRRYQSARELAVDLKRVLEPAPAPKPERNPWKYWWAGAAGVITAVVLVWIALHPPSKPARFTMSQIVSWPSKEDDVRLSPDHQWISFQSDRSGIPTLWRRHLSGGDPEEIVSKVGNVTSHVWSPDGSQIAFLSLFDQRISLRFINPFGGPVTRVQSLDPSFATARLVRWAGPHLYFEIPEISTASSNGGLWRFDLSGLVPHQLIKARDDSGVRKWFDVSADGSRAAFELLAQDQIALWTSDVNGGHAAKVEVERTGESHPHLFGTGGRYLAYLSAMEGQPDIWSTDLKNGHATQITFSTGQEMLQDVSDDGSLLTFVEGEGVADLWTQGRNGMISPRQLTMDSALNFWPSAGANTVAFLKLPPGLDYAEPYLSEIYVARLDPTGLHDAHRVAAKGGLPELSPDGKRLAYVEWSAEGRWELWLRDLDHENTQRVSDRFAPPMHGMWPLLPMERNLCWSGDAQTLFFVGRAGHAQTICRLSMAGSLSEAKELLRTPEARLADLTLSPDGSSLAYVTYSDQKPFFSEIHRMELSSGADQVLLASRDDPFVSFKCCTWWGNDRLFAVRATLNSDYSQRLEFLELSQSGQRQRGVVDKAFAGSVRLDEASNRVYLVRNEGNPPVQNLVAYDLRNASIRALTDNQSPSMSFAGLELLEDGTLLYSRLENNPDPWIVQREP